MKRFFLLLCLVLFQSVSGADFSDASIVLLQDKENVIVNDDGTAVTTDHSIYKIMNYQGLQSMQTIQLHFNTNYETIKVSFLTLIKPDGRRISIDPEKNSSIAVEDSQMEASIYDPAQKVMTVNIPGLEIGDTIEVKTVEKSIKSRIPGQWSDICVLQSSCPIVSYEYTVSLPENKPLLGICIKDEVPGTITHSKTVKDGRIIYTWKAANVPQAVPEVAMPAMYTCIQRLLVSTVGSWEDISRWYDKLCEPRLAKVNDEMKKKTAELIDGKTTDLEKINAIFQFVSQEIRYTGITDEDTAPGYEPHDVDKTFNQRHGVCRDKAALLAAMLRIAGFKAYPVLFMSGTPKDKEIANIMFNHAITGVETAPGEYLLMDPTFETTTELLPGYLAGYQYLAAKPEGDTLRTAPPTPPEKNMLTINTNAGMQTNAISVNSVLDFAGTYDQIYRAAFSEWTSSDVQNFISAQIRKIAPGAELKKLTILPENIRDMNKPLQIKLEYTVPNTLKNAEAQILQMPRGAMVFGMLNSLFSTTTLKSRRFPLRAMPRTVKENISMTVAPGMEICVPESLNLKEKGLFQVRGNFYHKDGELKEKFEFVIESMLIPAADYQKFKSAVSKAKNMWQTLPVVTAKTAFDDTEKSGTNVTYTNLLNRYDIQNNHTWTQDSSYSFKVLNYAGMKEMANLNFNFVEGVETLKISGSVIQPDGKKYLISDKDITIMDAPDTASAFRYLKRKIAVVTIPGLTVGSSVSISVTRTTAKQPFFYAQLVTRKDNPVKKQTLIIDYPAQMPLKFSEIPRGIQDSSTLGGKRPSRRFTVTDAARLAYEPGQPSYDMFVPSVRISGGDYGVWSREIICTAGEKVEKASPEVAAIAKKIADEAKPDEMLAEIFRGKEKQLDTLAKIFAVEKFVYKNIRLIDLPLNKMFFDEYSLPQTTLKEAYGNSVDRAILMAAMLKSLGIKYDFVPMASDVNTTEELNQVNQIPAGNFDKLLVYLPEYKIYLNDSGLYGIPGHLHSSNATIFNGTMCQHLITGFSNNAIFCRIDLQKDHSAIITLNYTFNGTSHEVEAERFASFIPAREKQHIETLAAGISPDAEIIEYKFAAEYNPEKPDLMLKLKVADFAKVSNKFISFQLPEFSKFSSVLALSSQLRKNPFMLNSTRGLFVTYAIKTPENYRMIPRNPRMQVNLPSVFTSCTYNRKSNYEHEIGLVIFTRHSIIQPDDFPRMLELKGTIDHLNTKTVLFTAE